MLIECFRANDFTLRHFSINNHFSAVRKTFRQHSCVFSDSFSDSECLRSRSSGRREEREMPATTFVLTQNLSLG